MIAYFGYGSVIDFSNEDPQKFVDLVLGNDSSFLEIRSIDNYDGIMFVGIKSSIVTLKDGVTISKFNPKESCVKQHDWDAILRKLEEEVEKQRLFLFLEKGWRFISGKK